MDLRKTIEPVNSNVIKTTKVRILVLNDASDIQFA